MGLSVPDPHKFSHRFSLKGSRSCWAKPSYLKWPNNVIMWHKLKKSVYGISQYNTRLLNLMSRFSSLGWNNSLPFTKMLKFMYLRSFPVPPWNTFPSLGNVAQAPGQGRILMCCSSSCWLGVGQCCLSGPRGPKSQPQVSLSGLWCQNDFLEQSSWEQSKQEVCSSSLPRLGSACCPPSHLGPLPAQIKSSATPLFPACSFNIGSSSWPGICRETTTRRNMRFKQVFASTCQLFQPRLMWREMWLLTHLSQGVGSSPICDSPRANGGVNTSPKHCAGKWSRACYRYCVWESNVHPKAFHRHMRG